MNNECRLTIRKAMDAASRARGALRSLEAKLHDQSPFRAMAGHYLDQAQRAQRELQQAIAWLYEHANEKD